jgi:capping protein (actin filament) muscle Z-line, beta
MKGSWDAIHVFDVKEKHRSTFLYRLTSTVMLHMMTMNPDINNNGSKHNDHQNEGGRGRKNDHHDKGPMELGHPPLSPPPVNLSGNLSRHIEQEHTIDERLPSSTGHLIHMGQMVEEMEIKIRMALEQIYFGKTKDIVNQLRILDENQQQILAEQYHLQSEVKTSLLTKNVDSN